MFYQDDCPEGPLSGLGSVVSQTYEESVRDLINDERQYLRDLHMIIKVIYFNKKTDLFAVEIWEKCNFLFIF